MSEIQRKDGALRWAQPGAMATVESADGPGWPAVFKELWRYVGRRSDEQLLHDVGEWIEVRPEQGRRVLATWLAQKMGYRRWLRNPDKLVRQPLWEALSVEGYGRLDAQGRRALVLIAASDGGSRRFLHPSAALATLAIWRHEGQGRAYEEARERLAKRALPAESEWLFEVVDVFASDGALVNDGANGGSLAALVEWVLAHHYWEVAAKLAGLVLVHRYGRWLRGAATRNLVHACDLASERYPYLNRRWIRYMAQATMKGRLRFQWLEKPLKAAVRLHVEDRERQEEIRAYLRRRAFEVDHRRLEDLYRRRLEGVGQEHEAYESLLKEVEWTQRHHPSRALKLLELVAMRRCGQRFGTYGYRLKRTLECLATQKVDERLVRWLLGLYVKTATLDGTAVRWVRRLGPTADWEANPFVGRQDYELFLVISDYDRAFETLSAKYDGVTLAHADKYGAAQVQYFVHKRLEPSRVHRLIQKVIEPLEWVGVELSEVGWINQGLEAAMERLEQRSLRRDLRDEVLAAYEAAGVEVGSFEEIAQLSVVDVERVIGDIKGRRMVMGAATGGVTGAFTSLTTTMISLADIPVMLGLTVDICTRFCWYYGFDPKDKRELPLEILAVALSGTGPEAIEPLLVRQNWQEHILSKSLLVGALAHGGAAHLAGRGLVQAAGRLVEGPPRAGIRHRVSQWWGGEEEQIEKPRRLKGVSMWGAALGAGFNAVLLYDICEAAEAVLTDRFLERKYPDWRRHIGLPEGEERVS